MACYSMKFTFTLRLTTLYLRWVSAGCWDDKWTMDWKGSGRNPSWRNWSTVPALLWWNEERENLRKGSRCPAWGSNQTFPEYVSETMAFGPTCYIAALVVKKCIAHQGCLILGRRFAVINEFCTVVPNIWASSVRKFLRVTSLTSRIFKWLLEFWKIVAPLFLISVLFILARPRIPLGHLVIHLWCTVFNKQLKCCAGLSLCFKDVTKRK